MNKETVVNSFTGKDRELLILDTGDVMVPAIACSLQAAPKVYKEMFSTFGVERPECALKSLFEASQ